MASEEEAVAEETCNTETEEETLALRKKRSRRVSFAETTAIHIFDRDEEYDTPPDPKPGSGGGESPANEDQWLRRTESDEINELLQSDEEDNGCDADDDDEVVRSSFLRPIESPSPGSYFGSATSNDDDNYFGPVSVDFIKPGQLSDSAASDDNHDITMDSTVFSMHFCSLAKSDSGAECKTPTGMYLAFEDRTPSQTKLTANVGNSMVLTGAKKPFLQSSLPDDKQSAGDSNDMSLVGENPHKYDYGKLSPGLDALLSPDHNNIQAGSPSYHAEGLNLGTHSGAEDKLPTLLGNKHGIQKLVDLRVSSSNDKHEIPSESVSPIAMNIDEADRNIETIAQQPSSDCSKKDHLVTKSPTDGQLGTPNQQSKDILTVKGIISDKGTSEAGSISSLYAKRQHIFSDANNSSHHRWDSTPLRNIPGSFNRRECAENVRSLVSFEKSSSRLERPEHFPFASTSKIVNHSRLMLPHHVSRSPIRALVKESRIDNQINHVTAPIVRLEDQFTSVIVDKQEERSISNRDINDLSTFENCGSVRDSEDVDVVRHGTSSYSPTWLCSHDSNSEQFNATASPPRFELSRENSLKNLLSTTNNTEGVLHSMRSDLSSQEITLNDKKYQDEADTYEDKAHSLEQGLKNKGSGSEKHEESISTGLNLQANFEGKRDGAANECTSLNADVENCDSHFHEKMSEIGASSIDTESFDGFAQVNKFIDQDILVNNPQSTSFQDGDFGAYAFCSSNHSVQASKELTSSVKICECPSKEELQSSPSRKDLSILPGDNNPHIFVGTSLASPKSNQLMKEPVKSGINQSGLTLHMTSSLCHHDSASKLKRKCGELAHGGKGYVDETDEVAFVQPSPFQKLVDQRHDAVFQKRRLKESDCIAQKVGGVTCLRHWSDVLTSFSGASKELLSPSINMLNLQAIEKLEDILVHLQKVKIYEALCSNISFQKVTDQMSYAQNRRVADLKLLLHRTMYEKAKLQLMHVKRDKLLSQVQSLNSGLQDSVALKSRFCQSSCMSIKRDSPVVQPGSSEVDLAEKNVNPDEKIARLRQSLENSGSKIKNLTQSFRSYFKMKEEPDCFGTILFVQDHLKKTAPCRLLQLELQPWEVESLETKSGQQDVVINFSCFIFQRLKINTMRRPSVAISNKLNESKILKVFRKMDACVAFRYVWSGMTNLKYVGPMTLAEQIQRTSSTLCNLLDVLEEIAVAQLELQNLIQATFCVRSDEMLDLQLCFVDFKNGRTVNLSLDFSCLKCGIYPYEVMPYDVNGASGDSTASSQSLLADIRAALGPPEGGGYTRVIRLCRIVSNLLQASKNMATVASTSC